jgi:hypothetical protein
VRRLIPLAALLALVAGAPHAAAQSIECPDGLKPMVQADLYFGRKSVSEARWARFLASEVTTRFPAGLTVIDAKGQWRNDRNVIAREPSKVLTIVLPGTPEDDARLRQIVAVYKTRFRQQSVGLVMRPVCAAF